MDPLANSKGRDNIRKVAGFYINNRKNYGNGRLTYNNFNVKVKIVKRDITYGILLRKLLKYQKKLKYTQERHYIIV